VVTLRLGFRCADFASASSRRLVAQNYMKIPDFQARGVKKVVLQGGKIQKFLQVADYQALHTVFFELFCCSRCAGAAGIAGA
jgi:hypothetical protein